MLRAVANVVSYGSMGISGVGPQFEIDLDEVARICLIPESNPVDPSESITSHIHRRLAQSSSFVSSTFQNFHAFCHVHLLNIFHLIKKFNKI